MRERRWSKFWWEDYEGDPLLAACSLTAQGVWMRMLCLMHRAEPYGHLLINGKQPSMTLLASVMRTNEKTLAALLHELEEHGVFSRTDDGTIISRRMIRDAKVSDEGSKQIEKRWGKGEHSGKSRSQMLSEARKKGQHTDEEWNGLVKLVDGHCPRCGTTFGPDDPVKDHITPIYLGGSDAIDNIQPLCQKCNRSKGPEAKDYRPKDWRQRLRPQDVTLDEKRLGERLGCAQKTSTLEAEAEAEKKEEPLRGSKKEAPRSALRLPPDWHPSTADIAFAASLGLVAGDVAERFRDYWHAKAGRDATKRDWSATWRNWCREDARRLAERIARAPPQQPSKLAHFRDLIGYPTLNDLTGPRH